VKAGEGIRLSSFLFFSFLFFSFLFSSLLFSSAPGVHCAAPLSLRPRRARSRRGAAVAPPWRRRRSRVRARHWGAPFISAK
jgi:hypothetical protein